jgi:hypothetical protein
VMWEKLEQLEAIAHIEYARCETAHMRHADNCCRSFIVWCDAVVGLDSTRRCRKIFGPAAILFSIW